MKKLFDRFKALDSLAQIFIGTIAGGIIGFLILFFGFFTNLYSLPLGWVLGILISLLNQFLLYIFSSRLLNVAPVKKRYLNPMNYFLRYLIYAIGFALSLTLDYFGFKIFNIFTVFGGYMLSKILVLIIGTRKEEL